MYIQPIDNVKMYVWNQIFFMIHVVKLPMIQHAPRWYISLMIRLTTHASFIETFMIFMDNLLKHSTQYMIAPSQPIACLNMLAPSQPISWHNMSAAKTHTNCMS